MLCHADDLAAVWAYHGLRSRGLDPLEVVTAEALSYALRLEHRIGEDGTGLEVRLADDRRIVGARVRGVLNRLRMPVLDHWRGATEKDRDYVLQETYAFYSSWLYGLPGRVLNPATAGGLCGVYRPDPVWRQLAAQAGLATRTYHRGGVAAAPAGAAVGATERRTLIVVDGAVTGDGVPARVARGCRRLAELSATPLLGLEFEAGADDPWTFVGASPSPDLRAGGEPLLEALEEALR